MIRITNGHYTYEQFQLTMDFEIPQGALVAVVGPSGAGKSTLLSLIAGFEPLSRGDIAINGITMHNVPPADRPVSMVFQDHNAFAHLSAQKNVALGVSPSLKLSEDQHRQVLDALSRVGIGHLADRLPGEMSGGERQRIALARALVRRKPILLLDEPFTALGPALRHDMLDLVKALHAEQNLTVMMVTHDPDDAKRIADRVIFVSDGSVRSPIATGSFFTVRDKAVQSYLG